MLVGQRYAVRIHKEMPTHKSQRMNLDPHDQLLLAGLPARHEGSDPFIAPSLSHGDRQ